MAKDRVQILVNLTYEKIQELEDLLCQESKLIGIDVSGQLTTILFRQKEVVERALRSIGNVRQNGNVKSQPSTSQTATAASPSPCFSSKTGINLPSKGAKVEMKEIQTHGLTKSKSQDNNARIKSNSTIQDQTDSQHTPSKGKDASWYGSLDRNFVKRKKGRASLDKSRRNRRTVASLVALEQNELQPDEHYEIGLPLLATNANFSKLSLDTKRQTTTVHYMHENTPFSGPGVSPSLNLSTVTVRHLPASPSLPVLTSTTNYRVTPSSKEFHNTHGGSSEHSGAVVKSVKSKAWFETNLDDSSAPSLLLSRSNLDVIVEPAFGSVKSSSSENVAKLPLPIISPKTDISEKSSRSSESSDTRLNFLNESTKPFEMSDYYKYSTKFRRLTEHTTGGTSGLADESKVVPRIPHLSKSANPTEKMLSFFPQSVSNSQSSEVKDHNGNPMNPFNPPTPLTGKGNTKSESGACLYQNILLNAAADPLDDELAWVMDTPTFV